MLTIREPISLNIQRPMQSVREDMAEKMKANYGIMNTLIRKEELLHITSEPPEIYFAEGNDLNLFTNIKNENIQEVRLDVINNLLNRIMVAQTENFTYQDTVYISSILRKLGIRDEKTFMKQIFALQNEHRQTNNLLKKYEDNQTILKQLFEEGKEKQTDEERAGETFITDESRWYIHNEIFKRLETSKIYEDMRFFTKGVTDASRQIFRSELNIGEQSTLINNFKLNKLKQEISGNEVPLYYFRNNQYEYLQEIEENVTEAVEEQISAAILLNLADQIYSLRQDKIEENSHYWYSVAGALFQSAENTWKRYEANITEQKKISGDMVNTLEEVNETKHIEGDTIEKIVAEYNYLREQIKTDTDNRQYTSKQGDIFIRDIDEINIGEGSFHLTKEELELNFLKQEEEEKEREEKPITAEQLKKQLEVFSERNFENYKKLTEIEKQVIPVRERKPDRKRMQQDALRAIENPQEVLTEYLTRDVKDPVREANRQVQSKIYELFSEDTKEIYRAFLEQNNSSETTFLQHIMSQPEENEIRQEVVKVIENAGKDKVTETLKKELYSNTEISKPAAERIINNEVIKHMTALTEIQNSPVYEKWINPVETYMLKEKETELINQMSDIKMQETVLADRITTKAVKELEKVVKTTDGYEKQPMIHAESITETEEILFETEKNNIITVQEKQLNDIKQTIEKQIKRQQTERSVELENSLKEFNFSNIDLIHKVEEKIDTEELMENIRLNQQKTRKEEHTEETTINKNKVNETTIRETINNVQVTRMEDIEEMVQQTVKRQMGRFSDQVYGKLEKKLQTERKRRGY